MTLSVTIRLADFDNEVDGRAIVELVDMLASWPSDHGDGIAAEVRQTLIHRLSKVPGAFVLLALNGNRVVALAVCFEGFSTFHARPLINIHDFIVRPEARGLGVGRKLLARIEEEARHRGCCRIVLEVYESNEAARGLYESFGFDLQQAGYPVQYCMTKRL